MAGYDVFARYYDALTANVDYKGRAAYLKKLLEHLHHEPGIVLDLACGTGSLTLELAISVSPFEQFDSGFELGGCDYLRSRGFAIDT